MFLVLKIKSLNKTSIKNFFKFINKLNNKFKLRIIQNNYSRPSKVTVYSILTSPHVNKTSQEQFKKHQISNQINLFLKSRLKILLILKKIQRTLFPDLFIVLQVIVDNKLLKIKEHNLLNPDNKPISFNTNIIKTKLIKKIYIRLFDIFGESRFKLKKLI